jgi:O-acetylhomoserine/O-acetylserine sulfhydrylase-like pyridoxal-dependent enzyme
MIYSDATYDSKLSTIHLKLKVHVRHGLMVAKICNKHQNMNRIVRGKKTKQKKKRKNQHTYTSRRRTLLHNDENKEDKKA